MSSPLEPVVLLLALLLSAGVGCLAAPFGRRLLLQAGDALGVVRAGRAPPPGPPGTGLDCGVGLSQWLNSALVIVRVADLRDGVGGHVVAAAGGDGRTDPGEGEAQVSVKA